MSTSNNYEIVSIRLPKNVKKHLKQICISLSKQEGEVISLSEFIRSTMIQTYPLPKQLTLFEKLPLRRLKRIIVSDLS
jgi:hypothetical protein